VTRALVGSHFTESGGGLFSAWLLACPSLPPHVLPLALLVVGGPHFFSIHPTFGLVLFERLLFGPTRTHACVLLCSVVSALARPKESGHGSARPPRLLFFFPFFMARFSRQLFWWRDVGSLGPIEPPCSLVGSLFVIVIITVAVVIVVVFLFFCLFSFFPLFVVKWPQKRRQHRQQEQNNNEKGITRKIDLSIAATGGREPYQQNHGRPAGRERRLPSATSHRASRVINLVAGTQ
jgi:hypothetical protein